MGMVRVKELIDNFEFMLAAGEDGIHREIITSEVHRPGIEVTGFFDFYPKERLQLIGRTEMAYLLSLTSKEMKDRVECLCTDITPGIIISRGMDIPDILIQTANDAGVPVLHSDRSTTRVISRLTNYLEAKFAPFTAVHGVLVDIYGIGVLITGQSGVGKSETALELVKRGHRLVADDNVEIRQEDYDRLKGSPPPLIKNLLEIRGVGIIDVMSLFGAGSVIHSKKISMMINLEIWDPKKEYDRLGVDENTVKIMDVHIPKSTIPIRPGRNIAIIIEVAAMNFRLKRMGVNSAENFTDRLATMISQGSNE